MVKEKMGNPSFDDLDLAATVAGETWEEVILEVSPKAVLRNITVAKLLNNIFKRAGADQYNLFAPKAPAVQEPLPVAAVPVQAKDEYTMKVKLGRVLNQSFDQEIPLLKPEELIRRRKKYEDWNGQSPLPQEQTSDAQTTAYAWLVSQQLNSLDVDFGVWTKFQSRTEKTNQ